jgi:hypothetical protein
MSATPRPLRDRFEDKIAKCPMSGCWLWTGGAHPNGYGGTSGGKELAHRASWRLFRGPIPKGLHVLHRCDVRLCVNPAHLFLGTQADNLRDCREKGRARFPGVRGERNTRSRLTAESVKSIRELAAIGTRQVALAREFGVTRNAIAHVVSRKTWTHI